MTKYLISFPNEALTLYPGSEIRGGFTVLELPTRADAVEWARRIAVGCRCSQELREFMYDPKG